MSQPTQEELYDPVDVDVENREVIEVGDEVDELPPNNIFIDDSAKEDKPKKKRNSPRESRREKEHKLSENGALLYTTLTWDQISKQ